METIEANRCRTTCDRRYARWRGGGRTSWVVAEVRLMCTYGDGLVWSVVCVCEEFVHGGKALYIVVVDWCREEQPHAGEAPPSSGSISTLTETVKRSHIPQPPQLRVLLPPISRNASSSQLETPKVNWHLDACFQSRRQKHQEFALIIFKISGLIWIYYKKDLGRSLLLYY